MVLAFAQRFVPEERTGCDGPAGSAGGVIGITLDDSVESENMCPSTIIPVPIPLPISSPVMSKAQNSVEQFLRGKLFRKLGSTDECLLPGRKEVREPLRGGLRNFL